MTSEAGRFCPPTLALALPCEHWYKVSWKNRSPSGILFLKRVNCVPHREIGRDAHGRIGNQRHGSVQNSRPLEQPAASGNCTPSGIVPISLQRFKQSGVSAGVELPPTLLV